ncbi:MAG TPA: protein kinase [Micromonosporaceae bacterium]
MTRKDTGSSMQQSRSATPVITGYRDFARIAEGGFSTVYTAFQETLGRTVAVKVLHADTADPVARQRFRDECELTGRLTGQPHIITTFDAGTTADQRFYIAMQYLPNGSLADRLVASGALPVGEVLLVGATIAEALEAAHAAGILHRDIKPGNILVSDQGEPVLSDFGIASLTRSPDAVPAFTRAHTAPEILRGDAPTVRSDIYALGSTLYTLLTATPPGDAAADAGLPELTRADVPAGLVAVLQRTLAADPARRPGDAAHLAAEFNALLGTRERVALRTASPPRARVEAPSVSTPSAPPAGAVAPDEPTRYRPDRLAAASAGPVRRGRRRVALIAATVAGVVLVAAGAVVATVVTRSHQGPRQVAAVSSATTPTHPRPSGTSAKPAPQAPADSHGTRPGPARSTRSVPATAGPAPSSARPSSAKPTPAPPTVCTPGCAGKAYFVAYGDHLYVCDTSSDGYGVVAKYWRTDYPGQNNDAVNKNGTGTCVDHNMNMPEGAKITFWVCLLTGSGEAIDCSGKLTTTA